MSYIQRFEDIKAWQEARLLTKQIYGLIQNNQFNKDFGLKDQIQRAAVSSMTNIAEGFDCDSRKEFSRFLGFAHRSAVEVQSLLYTALDAGYISQTTFNLNYEQARKTKALIGGFMKSLER